jgi:hypothetical protein
MGTYYYWANHTKKEIVRISSFGCGSKANALLTESTAAAISVLLTKHCVNYDRAVPEEMVGRWIGDDVEILADHGGKGHFGYVDDCTLGYCGHPGCPSDGYTDISEHLMRAPHAVAGFEYPD